MMLVAIAVVSICTSQADVLIIARDGSQKLSKVEGAALSRSGVQEIEALQKQGYVISEIEGNVRLAIDPCMPTLREIVSERLLLDTFARQDGPITFADLNEPTKRILDHIVGSITSDRKAGPDSQFMIRAEARFNLTFPGRSKNYVATYLLQGPTIQEMQLLGKHSLETIEGSAEIGPKQRSTAEFADSFLPGAALDWRVDVYEKCQDRIVQQLRIELELRGKAMKAALAKLIGAPNVGSGRSDVPPERLAEMRRNFLGSWSASGFASEGEAAEAWELATWSRGGVGFSIHFGDSVTNAGAPVIGGYEFAFSGR